MRKARSITALFLGATLALMPAIASAQPMFPPGGGHRPPGGGMHHGPRPGGPGPGFRHGGGGIDPGAAAAAGIIGLAVGAMAAGAAAEQERAANGHVNRCLRAYESYDPDTDTYIDRRGRERRCRL